MFINFWYPVAKSEEVKADEPFRAQILGLKFVAFRDDQGQAHVLSDTCVHRGGSLGKGWVKNNCVVCPYHGWEFSGDGKCQTVPSVGSDTKPPARAKVDAYPVQEKYGIVFAFLGDQAEEDRLPLYEIPEFGQDGWRANDVHVFEVDYYYERSMENGVDPAHNEFVHPTHGFSGKDPDYRIGDFDVETFDQGHGLWFWYLFNSPALTENGMDQARDFAGELKAGSGTYGPNTLITCIHMTAENWFHQYFFEAPIDGNRTRIFFINTRNCMLDEALDGPVHERNMVIAGQDVVVLSELDPVRTPDSNVKEILMPADRPIAAYREWLQKWENNGWRIDQQAHRALQGDVAVAIPSPGRRTSKNWVLDEIPLVKANAQAQQEAAE